MNQITRKKCNHIYSVRKDYRKCLYCGQIKDNPNGRNSIKSIDNILREEYIDNLLDIVK